MMEHSKLSTELSIWMQAQGIFLWGAADLHGFDTPHDPSGQRYPFAISWAVPMNPGIMVEIQPGPNQAYADEYARVNQRINELGDALAALLHEGGFQAQPLAASDRTDPVGIRGDFPHKTAATRAGLGWVGRNCQLITRLYGPWVRLGTVFTDAMLPLGQPVERSFCGKCRKCVDACPAGALQGGEWAPGLPREALLDAKVCDNWKKANYMQYHGGHNCGICSAVCPYGMKVWKKSGVNG